MDSDASILDRGWTRLTVSRTIDAPPDRVWAALADHEQWLNWYRPLSRFELVEGSELKIGTVVLEHEGPWKSTSEILEWDAGQRVGLATPHVELARAAVTAPSPHRTGCRSQ